MKSGAGSMIALLLFASGALAGLWFYMQPERTRDLVAQANADLASIDSNLDALEQAAARINAPSPPPAASDRLTPSRASGTSELLLTSLGRDKCRDILPRLLGSSGRIGSTVLLNGQPVKSAHGCRSSGNRIEVLM